MNDNLEQNFIHFRTGDLCFSGGENIGDLMIFIGRQSTIQHSCILVWLDVESLRENKVKVHPWYIDEQTTALSFLGLAQGGKYDILTKEKQKGLILYEPEELFSNAPIAYVRGLSREYISDEYVCQKMEEYIEIHHLKMTYAYGTYHIVTVGLGFDVFGPHKTGGKLCSENIYIFLEHLCGYPEFKIDRDSILSKGINEVTKKEITFPSYKVPDAIDRMYVPDFFSSDYNTHPVMEKEEVRVIGCKNEEDITVWHPYFIAFVMLVFIGLFLFLIINNYCESCSSGKSVCLIDQKDVFDLIL